MQKFRKRDMRLCDYNISKAKYGELKYFCMQYSEKLREINDSYGTNAVVHDSMPKGNLPGNPTERVAIRNVILHKDVELIEQTAMEAGPEIYRWLLKNVTEGVGYDYLGVPVCRADFYSSRKYFFFLLSQKR